MKYLSVCSGIEAATTAWHHLGWKPVAFSEVEPFPSAVLAHHWPDTPNLGDMTKYESWQKEKPFCRTEQRSSEGVELKNEIRPLDSAVGSNNEGPELTMRSVRLRDGETCCRPRSCDGGGQGDIMPPMQCQTARHRGRRLDDAGARVLVREQIDLGEIDVLVGGTPCQAFSVAGLRNSLSDERGNLTLTYVKLFNEIDEQRKNCGKSPAICIWENVPGVLSTKDNAFGCFLAALAGENDPLQPPGGKWKNAGYVSGPKRTIAWRCLDAQYFGVAQRRKRIFVVASSRDGFCPAAVLFESESVRRDSPPSREARQGVAGTLASRLASGKQNIGTLMANSGTKLWLGNQEAFSGDYHILQPIAFPAQMSGTQCTASEDLSPNLQAKNPTAVAIRMAQTGSNGWGINTEGTAYTLDSAQQAVAFGISESADVGHCLRSGASKADKHESTTYVVNTAVRRLTPTECERLQGFPDDHTLIPWRGKPADQCPDGPRYKALGNSMAVPVMRWIGERIQKVYLESLL